MRRSVILAASAVLALSAGGVAIARQAAPAPYATAAAKAPVRTTEDRARDEARHTAETLAFAHVQPGQTVGDMIMGGGYFTRVFSAAVGPTGHVVAWQPAEFISFGANYGKAVTDADLIDNVDAVACCIGAPAQSTGMDLIFTAQNYHDLHLRPFPADTAAGVNAAAFAALKPGGLYVIVDHDAVARFRAGSARRRSPHRRRADRVLAAGFVLDGQSEVLANPADPRTASVFDPSIRGHTSQFMLPRSPANPRPSIPRDRLCGRRRRRCARWSTGRRSRARRRLGQFDQLVGRGGVVGGLGLETGTVAPDLRVWPWSRPGWRRGPGRPGRRPAGRGPSGPGRGR